MIAIANPVPLFDAYSHVSLPRFLSGDEMLRLMDRHSVGKSLICTAPTCPDLLELSRSLRNHPDRFQAAGLPIGRTKAEILEGAEAQLDSGFCGLRVIEDNLLEYPELLELLARRGACLFLIGGGGFPRSARTLALALDRHPGFRVFAPHFAGGGEPGIFEAHPAVSRLFDHDRFFVIFSRQGAFDQAGLEVWASALIQKIGWDRLLFGSEFPVPLYRDEGFDSTWAWMSASGLAGPGLTDGRFLRRNAARVLFNNRPEAFPLAPRWQRMDLRENSPVFLFRNPVRKVPEPRNRKWLEAYLASHPSANHSYKAFVRRRPHRA